MYTQTIRTAKRQYHLRERENGHDSILKTLLSKNTDYTDFEYKNGNQPMIKVENRQGQLERIVEICIFRSNRYSKTPNQLLIFEIHDSPWLSQSGIAQEYLQ